MQRQGKYSKTQTAGVRFVAKYESLLDFKNVDFLVKDVAFVDVVAVRQAGSNRYKSKEHGQE